MRKMYILTAPTFLAMVANACSRFVNYHYRLDPIVNAVIASFFLE